MENGVPLLINNMTQHSLSRMRHLNPVRNLRNYALFETTPLSWGSDVLGNRKHPSNQGAATNPTPECLTLGTCSESILCTRAKMCNTRIKIRTCSYLPSCLLRNVFCVQWKCQGQQHLLTLVSHCPSQIECLSLCDVLCVLSHLLPVTTNLTELQLPLGIFEKSWTVRLVQNCVSLLGMETGRHFLWYPSTSTL